MCVCVEQENWTKIGLKTEASERNRSRKRAPSQEHLSLTVSFISSSANQPANQLTNATKPTNYCSSKSVLVYLFLYPFNLISSRCCADGTRNVCDAISTAAIQGCCCCWHHHSLLHTHRELQANVYENDERAHTLNDKTVSTTMRAA